MFTVHQYGIVVALSVANYRTARAAALGSAHHDHMKYYIPTLTHSPLSLVQTDPQLVQELSDEVAMR